MFVFFSLNTPKDFVAGISELSGMNTVMDPTYLTLFLFCLGVGDHFAWETTALGYSWEKIRIIEILEQRTSVFK